MSQTYPGIFAETSSASSQAAQFASGSQSPLNPAMLAVGSVQFMSGAGGTYGNNVLFNNVAGEITIASDNGQYGYLGTAGIEWYYLYYYNAVQASRRELKRDITYTDEEISDFLMSEIEQMKPAFYKYNLESDELIAGKEQKTRYNMHMGFILDETPDYIQDNSFSGIDIYALSTLSISGVQHNRKSIVEIEEKIENSVSQISDFGIAEINGTEIYVEYSQDFKGETPVVNITPNSPVSNFYISSQNDKGFTLSVNGVENFRFNWVALARYSYDTPVKSETYNIDPALMSQLRVDQAKKEQIHNLLMRTQEDLMELKSPDSNKNSVKRFIKK
ncbi:MAG: hypothetical protein C0596_06890 [Marinilabiliales bacterium]|nr:MAG: hypothetical protein C0596_06890 [Marinilabiliales bacterium]